MEVLYRRLISGDCGDGDYDTGEGESDSAGDSDDSDRVTATATSATKSTGRLWTTLTATAQSRHPRPMTSRIPLPGAFTRRPFLFGEAAEAGLGRSRLDGADLARPFWGVRTVAGAPTLESLCHALQLRLPPHAFFSHATAAQILGLPVPLRLQSTRPLHVAVVAPTRAVAIRGVIGHRLLIAKNDVGALGALRLTGPVRTWLDLAAQLTLLELVAVGDFLVCWRHPFATVAHVTHAAAAYPGRRGSALIRTALPLLRTRSESPRESMLRVIIVLAGLPEPECNVEIFDPHGLFLARGDLVYRRYKLLLEYQGDYHRTDKHQWRRDIARLSTVEDYDWKVLQYTDDDLKVPDELVARLERRLRSRGWDGTRGPSR
jgi:hypothetical protein